MQQTVELKGRPASRGIAFGSLVVLHSNLAKRVSSGDPATEKRDLELAIATAVDDIVALTGRIRGEGGDILTFQLAMLEDDSLKNAALTLIASNTSADDAWRQAMDAEISGYTASEDEYFRSRAADIADMRDRVLRHLHGGETGRAAPGAILAGEDVGPTLFLETDWSRGGGLLLTAGSATSHVAMLARARGVPMIVGLGDVEFNGHSEAIIDGESGLVVLSPGIAERKLYNDRLSDLNFRRSREAEFLHAPAVTADGVRIEVLINVAGVEDIAEVEITSCDGIGLMRTEFLFRDGAPLPDEEAQYRAYRKLLEWAGEKPVTIRTLDAGGDKPIRGVTPVGEKNPFLGQRGVRLTLARPDIFRPQLRALARAAVHGRLKVMLPMVTVKNELQRSAMMLDDEIKELNARGVPCFRPPLGIMVEVPAVAVTPEQFADAAFFSVGSNDLTQYVTASSRDEPSVAQLNDPGHPAVLKLIEAVARFGKERKIPVSICGDMASDPKHLESLLKAGLRSLSVAPAALARVKAALSTLKAGPL